MVRVTILPPPGPGDPIFGRVCIDVPVTARRRPDPTDASPGEHDESDADGAGDEPA